MTEDPTKDLTTDEKLNRILDAMAGMKAEMASMNDRLGAVESRLGALESLVEDRFRDTRPIWQAINARTERIEENLAEAHKELRSMNRKFEVFSIEMFNMKADIKDFDGRLSEIEQRPN